MISWDCRDGPQLGWPHPLCSTFKSMRKPLEERTIEEQRVCLQSTPHQDGPHHFQGCPKQCSAKLESNLSTHELGAGHKTTERCKCQPSWCFLQIFPILLRVIFLLEMRKQALKNTKSYPSSHSEALFSPDPHPGPKGTTLSVLYCADSESSEPDRHVTCGKRKWISIHLKLSLSLNYCFQEVVNLAKISFLIIFK